MSKILNDEGLDLIFRQARSYNNWSAKQVSQVTIEALYDLFRWGPTTANSCPGRFLFLTTEEAKLRLKPHLDSGNVKKVMTSPVTVIIAYDREFYEHLHRLFPHNPNARSWFDGDEEKAEVNAFRNGTLQGAYLMIAARALGLDCGPMSGFDNDGVDKEFFADQPYRSNFICAIGYGTTEGLYPRLPRFAFDEVCRVL